MLDQIIDAAPAQAWVAPSIGPDYGKARDQVALIRDRRFPTAMLLPSSGPLTPKGVANGVRRLTEAFGAPLILYLKSDDYLTIDELRRLMNESLVCGVKYAIPRENALADDYLRAIVESCGTDRIISGIGERPAIDHWRGFGIHSFTSGSVCIAPRLSLAMLAAMNAGRFEDAEQIREHFLALEQLRDEHSPIRVLHYAVAAAKIADTGPLTPLLSGIDDAQVLAQVSAATALLSQEESKRAARASQR
jgi:4-hydroxy-tetrahydrodipicolinate synthase